MKVGNLPLLKGDDQTNATQVPPSAIVTEEAFVEVDDVQDVTLISVLSFCALGTVLMISGVVYLCCKCKRKPTVRELDEENMNLNDQVQENERLRRQKAARLLNRSDYY